ncbi:MAG: efflux RND transporter periplasmic adaptor subunit [Candidatus Gastranaerophilales bacterium]|nr:efflux RND transporter periplasmic adaptor subunit [Candidatus Gastranaerophilales bacterium]
MKKLSTIVIIAILAAIAFRFINIKFGEFQRTKIAKANAVPSVEVAFVEEHDISKSIEIAGRIESTDKVDLVARIDGYLQKKHFSEGDFVKKGQVLLTIEPTQYLNNLNKARADLETAKANLYKTTRDYERGAELVKKDFISKSTYDSLYADKLSAAASVKAASAALAEAQRNYGYTKIKSPIDGKIGSLNIQEGNYVTVASGTLATVTKTNPIYVKYSVDSKQFDELKNNDFLPQKGQEPVKVDVILSNGKVYPIKGTQDFFDNQISTTTGTIDFRATIDNSNNELIPGDFVKVKVYSNKINKVALVPQDVALQDSNGRFVYTVNEEGLAVPKYFEDMGQYENYWIIKKGLEVGDKYITTGITSLMPNKKVKPIEQQAEVENK